MYLRSIHADTTLLTLRKLISQNPLGISTIAVASPNHALIQSSHIPFVLDVADSQSETEMGVLRGHLSRPNPQSKVMIESLSQQRHQQQTNQYGTESEMPGEWLDQEVMILFTSSVQHYVTPKFYTQTKAGNGKVVPTRNYAAVQAYGRARIYHDSSDERTTSFLMKQIGDLSKHAEENVMGFVGRDGDDGGVEKAWSVSDAPEKYISLMSGGIIGIEIVVDRLEGKFKMSQETKVDDRKGVIRGFEGLGFEIEERMAEIVRERGELKDAKAAVVA